MERRIPGPAVAAAPKPSPSGRGLGEGESPCARQPHMTYDAAKKSPPFAEPNEKPPFRKRGVGGIYTYTYTYTPPRQTRTAAAPTVIPAKAGIQNPG